MRVDNIDYESEHISKLMEIGFDPNRFSMLKWYCRNHTYHDYLYNSFSDAGNRLWFGPQIFTNTLMFSLKLLNKLNDVELVENNRHNGFRVYTNLVTLMFGQDDLDKLYSDDGEEELQNTVVDYLCKKYKDNKIVAGTPLVVSVKFEDMRRYSIAGSKLHLALSCDII